MPSSTLVALVIMVAPDEHKENKFEIMLAFFKGYGETEKRNIWLFLNVRMILQIYCQFPTICLLFEPSVHCIYQYGIFLLCTDGYA